MYKKIIWLIVIIVVIGGSLYVKFGYSNSQFQLRNSLRHVSATPIEHLFNVSEKSCGVWYERAEGQDEFVVGNKNEKVTGCFKEAFAKCQNKNILIVKDNSAEKYPSIVYSLVRVLRSNDLDECIVQNYFEEHFLSEDENPIGFINTCTVLSDELAESCQPLYAKEQRDDYFRLKESADIWAEKDRKKEELRIKQEEVKKAKEEAEKKAAEEAEAAKQAEQDAAGEDLTNEDQTNE